MNAILLVSRLGMQGMTKAPLGGPGTKAHIPLTEPRRAKRSLLDALFPSGRGGIVCSVEVAAGRFANARYGLNQTVILLFMTTQAVLQAEEVLLERGLAVDVIPRPDGVRGLCGIALELAAGAFTEAAAVLQEEGVSFHVYEPGGRPRGDTEREGGGWLGRRGSGAAGPA